MLVTKPAVPDGFMMFDYIIYNIIEFKYKYIILLSPDVFYSTQPAVPDAFVVVWL